MPGSLLVTDLRVNPAGPDSKSVTPTVTLTGVSLWSGGHNIAGVTPQLTVGGVWSILTVTEVSVLEFPAASVHVPFTTIPAVSEPRVVGPVQATGLPGTAPVSPLPAKKVTVTDGSLFHPAAFGAGVTEAVGGRGGVLSIRTVRVFGVSWFPALSTARYVKVVIPSAEIVIEVPLPAAGPSPVWAPLRANLISFTPDPPALSIALSETTASVLFQPLPFAAGS